MRLGPRIALLAAACLLATAGGAVAAPPGGPVDSKNGATVKLHSSGVARGGRIKVSGTKWRSKGSRVSEGAVVTIKLDDRDILAILPIRNKRFEGYVRIPRQVKTGRHWLRFLAAEPATSVKSTRFTVR
jgi:hypothetical protein